jgi:hypothetical protein
MGNLQLVVIHGLLFIFLILYSILPIQLATATNPSVGTVKNFIHLLDDSELDFDQELSMY